MSNLDNEIKLYRLTRSSDNKSMEVTSLTKEEDIEKFCDGTHGYALMYDQVSQRKNKKWDLNLPKPIHAQGIRPLFKD